MCGIVGIYSYTENQLVDLRTIENMCLAIRHRGPDDAGQLLDGPIGLGISRLSIIDVAGGHQPIHNENRTVWVVFNGEIYNYLDLKRQLQGKGHSFYTLSDTEVIVHAYEEWGEGCVSHFNGIFGLAIWDKRSARLLIARDPFGVKPLYYYDDGKRLVWASEVKAILEDRSVPREVDLNALDLFLTFRYVPSPFTMFAGIRKLPPGHCLIVETSGCRVARFAWPVNRMDGTLSEDDYIRLLQHRFESAVKRQMMSDVPIGALLSGGIDSAATVAVMCQESAMPIKTFTVGFREADDINELENARETARLLGTDHHEIVLDSCDYAESLQKSIWYMDEPIATTSALAMYFVCREAHRHVSVLLTGQGADEPHTGYARYLGEHYGGFYRHIPSLFRNHFILPIAQGLPRSEWLKRSARSLGTTDISLRFSRIYEVFSADERSALWRPELKRVSDNEAARQTIAYWRKDIEHWKPVEQMAYVDVRLSLADDLLMYADKMSMANSVEVRVPFLDLEYMAVAESLPARMRIRRFKGKYLHKKAVAKWLPPKIIARRKIGFDTPMDRWLRSSLSGYVRETLLSTNSTCREYFSPHRIDSLIVEHISGRQDNLRRLFGLLVFELWSQIYISRKD